MILLVLIGVSNGEGRECFLENIALTHVTANYGGVPRTGVG